MHFFAAVWDKPTSQHGQSAMYAPLFDPKAQFQSCTTGLTPRGPGQDKSASVPPQSTLPLEISFVKTWAEHDRTVLFMYAPLF